MERMANPAVDSASSSTSDSSSSTTEPHPKKVLLFGKTGSGKSTVANVLVTGGMERTVFKSSDGANGCTRKIQIDNGRGWTVVDTVGLGEAEAVSTKNDAKDMLTNFLKSVQNEYSHIIYLMKKSRIDTVDEMIWEIFVSLFEGGEAGFVVLFTSADEEWLNAQRDSLPQYMRTPGLPILVTDIPPIKTGGRENRYAKIRERSIRKLEEDLENLFRDRNYEYVFPKIRDMSEPELRNVATGVIDKVLAAMKRLFEKDQFRMVARMFTTLIDITGLVIGVVSLATQP